MNKYEIMFIVKPDVEEDARNAIIENFKKVLTNTEGTVDNYNAEDHRTTDRRTYGNDPDTFFDRSLAGRQGTGRKGRIDALPAFI